MIATGRITAFALCYSFGTVLTLGRSVRCGGAPVGGWWAFVLVAVLSPDP